MKFLHIEGHSERFTELQGEEKREGVVRGDWSSDVCSSDLDGEV